MSKSLDVIIDGELIGRLYNDNPLSFTYSEACLNGSLHSPIKNIIPVEFGKISTPNVHAYFENLLPEGDQRLSLENKFHVTSIFGLLEKAAWDSAGSVVLQPTGSIQESPQYKNKTWVEVAEIISGQTPYQEQIKTSISGAQYKILLSIDAVDASPLLPIGSTVTTHILKPDIVRIGQKIWASAANETIMMRAAQKCGLETAHVDYISTVKSCLVRRYDRVVTETGVDRINQFDICQLLKISSGVKYEVDGGPSFAQCYEQVKLLSINPIVDCESVLKWLMFNLLIGNNDSHAKNLSILMTSDGYRLAPFYDLMCTTVYPGFSSKFAFCLGGTYAPGEITSTELSLVAESINVSEKYLLKLAQDMSEQINPAIQASIKELEMQFSHQEKIMAERLAKEVAKICKKRITKLLTKLKTK
jgi:serine/threonine-protein kinase HipA